jgi:hypothetical protein
MKKLISLIVLAVAPNLFAAYQGAVSTATGGAGAAIVESSEIPFNNPAGLGHLKGYFFSSSMGRASQGELNDSNLALSVADNMRDTVIPTSISYNQNASEDVDKNALQTKQFRLSFGNMVSERVAFGLAITHEQARLLEKSYSDTNLTLGTILTTKYNLGLALLAENILPPNRDIPEDFRPTQLLTLGSSAHYKRLIRFRLDLSARLEDQLAKPILGAGVENYLNKFTILRLGYQRDAGQEANLYSGGLGFVLPRFGLHYGYQQSPQKQTLTRHSVDLAIPIW